MTKLTEYEKCCIRGWSVDNAIKASKGKISPEKLIEHSKKIAAYLLDEKSAQILQIVQKEDKK